MPHSARRQIGLVDVAQRRLGAGVLLGVVVYPLNADGAVEADAVELDHDLLDAVGVARRAGRNEIPTVVAVTHRPMAAEQAGAGMLATDLHPLNVRAVNTLAELADE